MYPFQSSLKYKPIIFCQYIILLIFISYSLPILAEPKRTIIPTEKVSIQLKWLHAFQFAGYYAAKEKGFYADEGLEVELKPRIPRVNNIEQVLNGKSEYGIADTGLLQDRLKGKPVVLLASIFQHNPIVYFTLKSSGITTPYQFKGKRVMDNLYGSASLRAMLYEAGISSEEFTHINHTFNINDLINGKVDAFSDYLTNQPYSFRQKNIEINIIDPRNYGIDFLGDNLFTTEAEIRQHPERVRRFLRATLKGWDYALKHSDEIINLILKKYNADKRLSKQHLRFEANETIKMIVPDSIPLGNTSSKRFLRIAQTYQQLGLVKSLDNLKGFIYLSTEQQSLNLSSEEKAWLQA
ncbi:MAG: hypothetical protein GQ569_05575, partial [Methylococcaceae bacterium]|nr:hypothetical protein [Methylococcaceae bacterium]